MRRHLQGFRIVAVALAALLAGCAHTPAIPPESYRSPEGFQGAAWGSTPGDLGARLDGAALLDPHTYRTHEDVDGRPATVTYSFPRGHLASVSVQFDPGQPTDFDREFDALSARLGQPLPPPGSRKEAEDEDEAVTVAAIVGAVLVIGLIVAIATHSGGGHGGHVAHASSGVHGAAALVASAPPVGVVQPVHFHDACWVDFAALELADASLHVAVAASAANASLPPPPPPAGGWFAEWRTAETDVMLFGVELGTPRANLAITYRSLALDPPPAG